MMRIFRLHPSRPRSFALRSWLLVLIALAPAWLHAQARFTIVGEAQTWLTPNPDASKFVAARAVPGPTRPVVMTGQFESLVIFPPGSLPQLTAAAGATSVFAGVLDYDSGDARWEVGQSPQRVDKLEPVNPATAGSPNSETRDLAVIDRTEYYVTGIVDDATHFENRNATTFPLVAALPIPPLRGFVARGDDGTFGSVHLVDAGIQPRALSAPPAGGALVVVGQQRDAGAGNHEGGDARVHRYPLPLPAAGSVLIPDATITSTQLDETALTEVAVSSAGEAWIGGTRNGAGFLGGSSDVWLGRADFGGNQIADDFRAGSEGGDRIHAMERGPHGEIYVAFTAGGRQVSFGALGYDLDADPPAPAAAAPHGFLGMIRSDGTPAWLVPLGLAQSAGASLVPLDIEVDEGGVACVSVRGAGSWRIEGVPLTLAGGGQVTVSGRGRVVDFSPAAHVGVVSCGAVPDLENRLVLGETGGRSAFSTLERVATTQDSHFVRWIDPGLPGNTIEALGAEVTALGGQVHNELDFPTLGTVGVSAWLTPGQVRSLENNLLVEVVADPLIIEPDSGFGQVDDPGWGLARLFDPYLVEADGPAARYFFPSALATGDPDPATPKKVRVYVIDKGLEAAEPFVFRDLAEQGGLPTAFDGANPVDVEALVAPANNGVFEPDTLSDHPRQVINLLAAAQLGAAQGAAMEIIPGDMYSGASPMTGNSVTYASYVVHTILNCIIDHTLRDFSDDLPALIVIASSGPDPLDQVDIGGAIQQAIDLGITVILSAGNSQGQADVAGYVPAMHGEKDGVITVGGTAFNPNPPPGPTLADLNPFYDFTNTDPGGQIISLYAPGSQVDSGFGAASGTSFSCALVAGLAANHLAAHPQATPAEVEAALVQRAVHDTGRDIRLARGACAFEAWLYRNGLGAVASDPNIDYGTDSDGDGDTDLWEFLGGSDPGNPNDRARVPVAFSLDGDLGRISAWLPDAVVHGGATLGDGCWSLPVTLQLSEGLTDWQTVAPDAIETGPAVDGLKELRFGINLKAYDERCFLRFDFGQPVSP